MIRPSMRLVILLILVGHVSLSNAHVAKDLVCKGCVNSGDLRTGAVVESKIKNGAVTGNKIKNGAVTGNKIKNGAVTANKIKNGAVTGNKIKNGVIDSKKLSPDLRNKINRVSELTSSHETLASRLSQIEDSYVVEDRFNYRYERNDRMAGEVFTVGDEEYEIAEFDVVSLLDHSVFSVKLPVQISSYHRETYPRYGLDIDINGEANNWRDSSNNTIDGYPANINYGTTMSYASKAVNTQSDLKSDFDADGQVLRATIYSTYMYVYKENTRVYCEAPSIDFDELPENLSYAVLSYDDSDMTVYYTDGTAYDRDVPISSVFSGLVSDCLNSDNYLMQQYSIETTIRVSVAINLDKDTYFQLHIRYQLSTPSAEVHDYDRSFSGVIDVANEIPTPDDRDLERQRIWKLLDSIVINKL